MSFSLSDLDPNDFSSWPLKAKIGIIVVACLALAFAGYWFLIKGQMEDLKVAQNKERQLKQSFLEKKGLAVNLPAYRKQMKQMEESFSVLLRQLPDKTEIPELLIDISQAGLGRGLQFELFQPQLPVSHEFYSEIPIKVRVVGQYHSMGQFVSDLAALPRVVTLGDVDIKKWQSKKRKSGKKVDDQGPPKLSMEATVKTYHYLDEESVEASDAEDDSADTVRVKRK